MTTRTFFALVHETIPAIVFTFDFGSAWIAQAGVVVETDILDARESWKAAVSIGFRRDREMEADLRADDAECAAGRCDHYTCTEGRSIDEFAEPEPTMWDYVSEAYGPTREVR